MARMVKTNKSIAVYLWFREDGEEQKNMKQQWQGLSQTVAPYTIIGDSQKENLIFRDGF